MHAILIILVCCVCLLPTSALAQTGPTPERVIHLWVDPLYGDDAAATAWSAPLPPSGNPPNSYQPVVPGPVYNRPNDHYNASFLEVLLHAPFPFLTITAAVNYIAATPGAPVGQPLPYGPASGTNGMVWKYAIIHLLPGLYSRGSQFQGFYGTRADAPRRLYWHNGLMANGETFPIRLPDGVSVKGTSTLNTVFELTGEPLSNGVPYVSGGPAFEFGVSDTRSGKTYDITGTNCVIDRVSIFGARSWYLLTPPSTTAELAGILCSRRGGFKTYPTITNCFLFGNFVGLLLDAPSTVGEGQTHHEVALVNNSFVWNDCGVWNGQQGMTSGSKGRSKLLMINNLFDSTPVQSASHPLPPGFGFYPQTASTNFEGVDQQDVRINIGSAQNPIWRDFNAYEGGTPRHYQTGWAKLNLPPTNPRSQAPAAPGIDLAPYTGSSITSAPNRGVLFVRDLFFTGIGNPAPVPQHFDQCLGDFRLAPAVSPATSGSNPIQPPGTNGALNPLVDAGWAGSFPVASQNGMVLNAPPGTLVQSSGNWPFTSWNEDCEGFGNPRIYDHLKYPNVGVGQIDVGADELGELAVAGYRFGTTFFMEMDNPITSISAPKMDNKYGWYLGPPTTLAGAPSYSVRPHFTKAWTASWHVNGTGAGTGYYKPTLADISPHLLPDVHPWWSLSFTWPSYPIWNFHIPIPPNPQINPYLYVAPILGIINPPGTYVPSTSPFVWLDFLGTPTSSQFGPFGGPATFSTYSDWCEAEDQDALFKFDTMPGTYSSGPPWNVVRYSIEYKDRQPFNPSKVGANIQSFMLITKLPQ